MGVSNTVQEVISAGKSILKSMGMLLPFVHVESKNIGGFNVRLGSDNEKDKFLYSIPKDGTTIAKMSEAKEIIKKYNPEALEEINKQLHDRIASLNSVYMELVSQKESAKELKKIIDDLTDQIKKGENEVIIYYGKRVKEEQKDKDQSSENSQDSNNNSKEEPKESLSLKSYNLLNSTTLCEYLITEGVTNQNLLDSIKSIQDYLVKRVNPSFKKHTSKDGKDSKSDDQLELLDKLLKGDVHDELQKGGGKLNNVSDAIDKSAAFLYYKIFSKDENSKKDKKSSLTKEEAHDIISLMYELSAELRGSNLGKDAKKVEIQNKESISKILCVIDSIFHNKKKGREIGKLKNKYREKFSEYINFDETDSNANPPKFAITDIGKYKSDDLPDKLLSILKEYNDELSDLEKQLQEIANKNLDEFKKLLSESSDEVHESKNDESENNTENTSDTTDDSDNDNDEHANKVKAAKLIKQASDKIKKSLDKLKDTLENDILKNEANGKYESTKKGIWYQNYEGLCKSFGIWQAAHIASLVGAELPEEWKNSISNDVKNVKNACDSKVKQIEDNINGILKLAGNNYVERFKNAEFKERTYSNGSKEVNNDISADVKKMYITLVNLLLKDDQFKRDVPNKLKWCGSGPLHGNSQVNIIPMSEDDIKKATGEDSKPVKTKTGEVPVVAEPPKDLVPGKTQGKEGEPENNDEPIDGGDDTGNTGDTDNGSNEPEDNDDGKEHPVLFWSTLLMVGGDLAKSDKKGPRDYLYSMRGMFDNTMHYIIKDGLNEHKLQIFLVKQVMKAGAAATANIVYPKPYSQSWKGKITDRFEVNTKGGYDENDCREDLSGFTNKEIVALLNENAKAEELLKGNAKTIQLARTPVEHKAVKRYKEETKTAIQKDKDIQQYIKDSDTLNKDGIISDDGKVDMEKAGDLVNVCGQTRFANSKKSSGKGFFGRLFNKFKAFFFGSDDDSSSNNYNEKEIQELNKRITELENKANKKESKEETNKEESKNNDDNNVKESLQNYMDNKTSLSLFLYHKRNKLI